MKGRRHTALALMALATGAGAFMYQDSRPAPAITWTHDVDAALDRARADERPVLIDFTASWCAACKQLEFETYADVTVRRVLRRFGTVQVDVSHDTPADRAVMQRFGVNALPAGVFVDATGMVLPRPRLGGYVPPRGFVELVEQVP